MTDPDPSGNKTVFRPSPLKGLKPGGQTVAPPPPPPPPPPAPPPPPIETVRRARTKPAAKPARGNGPTALIALFVVVTLLALGYVAVQLTTGAAPTFRLGAAATIVTVTTAAA